MVKNRKHTTWVICSSALLALVIGLTGFGVWNFWQQYQATHQPEEVVRASLAELTETVTVSTDTPVETPPACDDSYQMPADQPRKIELPSLGKTGCIQKVGIDQHNNIAVPTNIHVAGWFTGSTKPGEDGVSIIDGHFGGRYTDDAIFRDLNKLKPNELIKIEYGDRTWRTFTVVRTDLYSVDETAHQQFKKLEGIDKQLTLITCGGTYDNKAKTYNKRTVVRAALTL